MKFIFTSTKEPDHLEIVNADHVLVRYGCVFMANHGTAGLYILEAPKNIYWDIHDKLLSHMDTIEINIDSEDINLRFICNVDQLDGYHEFFEQAQEMSEIAKAEEAKAAEKVAERAANKAKAKAGSNNNGSNKGGSNNNSGANGDKITWH